MVATATIALQRQLIDRDLPRLATTLRPLLGQEPEFAILKGLHRLPVPAAAESGAPEDPRDISSTGRDLRVRPAGRAGPQWAAKTTTASTTNWSPAWTTGLAEVSVSAREPFGAQRCPFGLDCYAEQARLTAAKASIVVTNHALPR